MTDEEMREAKRVIRSLVKHGVISSATCLSNYLKVWRAAEEIATGEPVDISTDED